MQSQNHQSLAKVRAAFVSNYQSKLSTRSGPREWQPPGPPPPQNKTKTNNPNFQQIRVIIISVTVFELTYFCQVCNSFFFKDCNFVKIWVEKISKRILRRFKTKRNTWPKIQQGLYIKMLRPLAMMSNASASCYDVKCFSHQLWCQILLSLAIISVSSYDAKYFNFQLWCQTFQSPGMVSNTSICSHRLKCSNFFL